MSPGLVNNVVILNDIVLPAGIDELVAIELKLT